MIQRILLLLLTLTLILGFQINSPNSIDFYVAQGIINLEPNIMKFGYSPDQQSLVILKTGGQNGFIVYEGFRQNTKRMIQILDSNNSVSPSIFAFSTDNKLLIIGTLQGSLYAFSLTNGKIDSNYKYKYQIGLQFQQSWVKSINFANNGKIAVVAKSKLIILQISPSQQDFNLIIQYEAPVKLESIAWNPIDQNFIIAGGYNSYGLFFVFDVKRFTIQTFNTDKTTCIAVFPDGTVFQGKLDKQIEVFSWDSVNKSYITKGILTGSINATEISTDKQSLYFGAVIGAGSSKILAWKMTATQTNNLQSQNLESTVLYLSTYGQHLAMSNNGNQVLVVLDTNNNQVSRFSLCTDGSYYDSDMCRTCQAGCSSCFNENNCFNCRDGFYVNNNKCVSCGNAILGCKLCADSNACVMCDATQHWKITPENGRCQCVSTYYQKESVCLSCSVIPLCKSCISSNFCSICDQTSHANPAPVNGKCICSDGYYINQNKICQSCGAVIFGCLACLNQRQCIICDQSKNLILDPTNGLCQCRNGYWFDGQSCKICSNIIPYCISCTQDGKCNECSDKRKPNQDVTQCVCQDHTYQNQNQLCIDCDPYQQCLHCLSSQPHTCIRCDSEIAHRMPAPVNGKCLCQSGYIQVNNHCVKSSIQNNSNSHKIVNK